MILAVYTYNKEEKHFTVKYAFPYVTFLMMQKLKEITGSETKITKGVVYADDLPTQNTIFYYYFGCCTQGSQ